MLKGSNQILLHFVPLANVHSFKKIKFWSPKYAKFRLRASSILKFSRGNTSGPLERETGGEGKQEEEQGNGREGKIEGRRRRGRYREGRDGRSPFTNPVIYRTFRSRLLESDIIQTLQSLELIFVRDDCLRLDFFSKGEFNDILYNLLTN
jgi:hypothetical protein